MANYKVYLVGGAVRDTLLQLPFHERDYVVVGATPEIMLSQGYEQVGKSFPVFLHPETKAEYALARKERKTGKGYYGFECDFSPLVTLEEDLMRRDLTINAMAMTLEGDLVDPLGCKKDLDQKVLRHVSNAFVEDPVRLLRVARFLARFQPYTFKIDSDTMKLMQEMVEQGEVDHLIPERVWAETYKALCEKDPVAYFKTLRETGALKVIFPEIDRLYGVPQTKEYHPEIDTGVHVEMALCEASKITQSPLIRFAVLMHDLGKGLTPKEEWPSHRGHEARGVAPIRALCERLKVPAEYRDLSVLVSRFHLHCHRAFELKSSTIVDLFEHLDVFRREERLEQFLLSCLADQKGRLGAENIPYPQVDWLRRAYKAAKSIDTRVVLSGENLSGEIIKKKIHQARIEAVEALDRGFSSN